LLVSLQSIAYAGGEYGTKKDVVLPASQPLPSGSTLGGMQLLQMLVAVAIVVAILKFLLPKVLSKVNRRLNTSIGSSIRIEESASFAGGNLFVIGARTKTLLVCVSPHGVTCLADLSEPQTQEPKAFFEILDEAATRPQAQSTQQAAEFSNSDIQAALTRLARLER
jgi:hypothetical protein